MNIVFNNDGKENYITNNGIVYLLGPNQCGKTYILNMLKNGFSSKEKNFLVDNMQVNKNRFNVMYYDDTTDFNNEFKFSKSNLFRELIYTSALSDSSKAKLLKEINTLFDNLDNKVNQYLDININKKQENKVSFEVEIDDINDIIDKFTNIYVDNYLIKSNNMPRSIKRKMIYNLMLFGLKKSCSQENIVIIDNFDLYLDNDNTQKIIKLLEDYHNKNDSTYFFLSSCNNIFELVKDKSSVYRINNGRVNHIKDYDLCIQNAYFNYKYSISDKDKDFVSYINENAIILEDDITKYKREIAEYLQFNIGKLYVCNEINTMLKRKSLFIDNLEVHCFKDFYEYFYEYIFKILTKSD